MELCKSESLKELASALSKAQAVMEGAKKDHQNPYFKSRYANLESVWACARKPLADNGLSVVQLPGKNELGHFLETTLLHSSGEFISSRMFISPVKEDPQGIGSAITYARRYALMGAVGIAPEDDDGEAAMGREGATKASKPEMKGKPEEPVKNLPWRETTWHLEGQISKDKSIAYTGKTLGEIYQADPEGLTYWCRVWKPVEGAKGPSPKDKALRTAMDAAMLEIVAAQPKTEAPKYPKVVTDLVTTIQELCGQYKIPPAYVLEKANEKQGSPVSRLEELPEAEAVLNQVISHFKWIIDNYAKENR
jgi:hypothetical protein